MANSGRHASVMNPRRDIEAWHAFKERLSRTEPLKIHISRVNQMESGVIDEEIAEMFNGHAKAAMSFFNPEIARRLKPELKAVIDLLLFGFSTMINRSTPGQQLQNLIYRNENKFSGGANEGLLRKTGDSPRIHQRVLFALVTILLPYTWSRLRILTARWSESHQDEPRYKFWRILNRLDVAVKVCVAINFILFLRHGRYRILGERLANVRAVYPDISPLDRQVTFEYLNRQILWNAFTTFLMETVPLFDLSWPRRMMQRFKRVIYRSSIERGRMALLTRATNRCSLCGSNSPQMPYAMSCRHVACYFCVKTSTDNDSNFRCPDCSLVVSEARPLSS